MATKETRKTEREGEPRFEDALAELEGVVKRLEHGELPLEDSLVAFERGMGLVQQLSKRLEDIERRVEVLLKKSDGSLAIGTLREDDDEA
jgi:exodeoxyribonuclease VII small subunit